MISDSSTQHPTPIYCVLPTVYRLPSTFFYPHETTQSNLKRCCLPSAMANNREVQNACYILYSGLLQGSYRHLLSFHSLEDRIAKQIFRKSDYGKYVNRKVIKPTREEEVENKRSRSAKLRGFEGMIEESLREPL